MGKIKNPNGRDTPLSPIRIMVVDDNEVVRSSLKQFIESRDDFNYIGEAANGVEAISACAQLKPDLILMDIKMPVMNGVEATKIIRKQNPAVLILALSGLDDNAYTRNILMAGANNYVSKKTSVDNLEQAIFMTVSRKPSSDLIRTIKSDETDNNEIQNKN